MREFLPSHRWALAICGCIIFAPVVFGVGVRFAPAVSLGQWDYLSSFIVTDLDRDKNLDVVLMGMNGFFVATGNGNSGFNVSDRFSTAALNDCAAGDLNGDGFPDLVFAEGDF